MDFKKAMESSNIDIASDNHRQLLEGERVEVRQKERGLRGSWHSGTVVKVKYCRRVVEYDELFTRDGSKKLKETIPLCEEVKLHTSTRRDTIVEGSKPAEGDENVNIVLKKRGFIRPSPPPCLIPPRQDWKRGLLVDAFYNDAWWEGILLDDVTSGCEEFKTKIFFPEEGDELEIVLKDLRVSQEWDEASGLWAGRGYWFFNSELGLGALKEICIKVKCPLKDLWRQRRFCSSEDLVMQEQMINNQHSVEKTFQIQPPMLDVLKCPWYSISAEALGAHLMSKGDQYKERVCPKGEEKCIKVVKAKSRILGDSGENLSLVAGYNSADCPMDDISKDLDSLNLLPLVPYETSKFDSTGQLSAPKSKKKRPNASMFLNGGLAAKARASPRIAGRTFLRRNSLVQCMDANQEECRSGILNCTTIVDPLSCDGYRDRCKGMNGNDSRNNGTFSSDQLPLKVRVRQARHAAKTYLLSRGWKIDTRLRYRGTRMKYEAVYVSPNGSRFFSLASACREMRPGKEIPSSSPEGTDGVLDAYRITESLTHMHHLHTVPSSTKKISLSNGSMKDRCGSESPTVPELMDFKYSSPKHHCSTPDVSTQYSEETAEEKRKTSLSLDKSNKRKNEGYGGLSSVEPKRKRFRGSIESRKLPENKGSGVKGGCRMQVLLSCPERARDQNSSHDIGGLPQFKKSTVLSWLIDKCILKENEPVVYINRKDGQVMKKGKVTREGIMCDCCKDIFTLSNFEAHAGSKLHRPSANIFLDNGKSISDCQLEACALQDAKEKKEGIMDVSDDSCGVCGDGGQLILCDHCPSTFHADCIGLTVIPEGDWYCPRCSCGVCGTNQRMGDLDDRMLRCVQCELEYHLSCVRTCSVLPLGQAIQKIWFCDRKCQKIFLGLRRLVGITHPMEDGFSWMLLRAMKKNHALSQSNLEVMAEHSSKLSVAHDVMQECFVPMIDPRTRINLLSQALYNRRSKVARLNYGGFYTMLLERGDEIITVASIRIHGVKLAEMPLVGTRYQYRRQGMCRRLMHILEEMLKSVGVEKLILPAVPELLETWINAFGFQQMSVPDIQELSKLHLMTFPGTTLLEKHLLDNTNPRKPDYQPHTSHEVESLENPSCKSMEEFFSMTCASLDNNFLEGDMNGDISLINSTMFNYMQELFSDDQDTPELYMPSKPGKPKNRIRHKAEVGSPGDVLTVGREREDDIYTRVVVGTTRSKRQVKSRRWVADGLRELKDSKLSRRNTIIGVNSLKTPVCESDQGQQCELQEVVKILELQDEEKTIKNVYVRTRRKKSSMFLESVKYNAAPGVRETEDITNWDGSKISNYMNLPFSSSEIMGEIQFCPKFYARRKKREKIENILEVSKVDNRSGDSFLHQTSVTPVNGSNQEFLISQTPSFNVSTSVRPSTGQGGDAEMMTDDFSVTNGNAEMMINASNIVGNAEILSNDYNIAGCNGTTGRLINDSSMIGSNLNTNLERLDSSAFMTTGNADSSLEMFGSTVARTNGNTITDGNVTAEMMADDSKVIYDDGTSEIMADHSNVKSCNKHRGLERSGISDLAIINGDSGNSEALANDSNIIYGSHTVETIADDSNVLFGDGTAEVMVDDSNILGYSGDSSIERFETSIVSTDTVSGSCNAAVVTDDANVICASNTSKIMADDLNVVDGNEDNRFDSSIISANANVFSNGGTAEMFADDLNGRDSNADSIFNRFCSQGIIISTNGINVIDSTGEKLATHSNAINGNAETVL